MALTARQRNALPAAAFLDQRNRRFPVPTARQARAAGIGEAQRVRTMRNALARAAQSQPKRQAIGPGGRKRTVTTVTPTTARRAVKARAGGKVASVKPAASASRRQATGGTRRRTPAASTRRRATATTTTRRKR